MENNARADAPATPRNSKRLPLSIRHTIGLLNDSLGADDYHNTNCSFAQYDGVTFEFSPSAVEIRAPTWSLTVFFGNPRGDGTSYSIHLFGGSARPGSPPD
jgi:hypothetical protein